MAIQIPKGYELLQGRSGKNARAAIASAEERGFPAESVRSVREGYLIPTGEDLADRSAPASLEDVQAGAPRPDGAGDFTGNETDGLGTTQDDADRGVHEHSDDEPRPVESWTHDRIDDYAGGHDISYDGIEAEDVEKPTKAEKVAHINKALDAKKGE